MLMSHLLWKYYWENDVDRFRRLLAPAGPNPFAHAASKSQAQGHGSPGVAASSPCGSGGSPRHSYKPRKAWGHLSSHARSRDGGFGLSRGEVNSRDHAGLTILLRAASSTDPNARDFVQALIEHPAINIYAQDLESGWNALHRALYFGNVSIARLLLAKERSDLANPTLQSVGRVGQLIKTKDHEGNSPFDVYNSTIAPGAHMLTQETKPPDAASDSSDNEDDRTHRFVSIHPVRPAERRLTKGHSSTSPCQGHAHYFEGEELYVFGSNKNISLGVGDEDDRQFPKRILLQRPKELVYSFYESYVEDPVLEPPLLQAEEETLPNLIRSRPLIILDVVMSKLHSAVLTADPVSNFYVCGVGRGGRLGLGDENSQFRFVPVQGPFADRKIHQVALGQSHTLAIAGNGELWSFGLNSDAQLGYALPPPARCGEEPMSLTPRQVFGTLKKELVQGVAASAIHSVAHTHSSLYCWGRNVGQLALMDADSRSLAVQQTPRRVAASVLSAPIKMVSAIDKATVCLLANSTMCIFTNYGYNLVKFPVPNVFTNHSLVARTLSTTHDPRRKDIRCVTSGGETIAAVTARGDLFTMHLNHRGDANQHPAGSTTNPVKMKNAVTEPECIWDSRKDGVVSASVGEHGSVILCTESGAVWKRVKRTKSKAAGFSGSQDVKSKDFKFQRVPYMTDCVSVRSSTFGAFAVVRRDKKVMAEKMRVDAPSLWADVGSLLCLRDFAASDPTDDSKAETWQAALAGEEPGSVPHAILRPSNMERDLAHWLRSYSAQHSDTDVEVGTTTAPEIRIPVHGWVLRGRSCALREAMSASHPPGSDAAHSDAFIVERIRGKRVVTFVGVDVWTVLNVVLYAYQDATIPVWRYTRQVPAEAFRFRQVRSEVVKLATKLQMPNLDATVRLQAQVEHCLGRDMKEAISDPAFFDDGDVAVQLEGGEMMVHSQLVCRRCPFFKGMFDGRSQGQWLSQRLGGAAAANGVVVELKHISLGTFKYVLQHLYANAGEDMFNDVALPTMDDFSELILDVLSAANEMMLDRLSQVCQLVLGRFVTTRNISNLLNEISPCHLTEFKDAGLEYMCLQLECMLENQLLDSLDEDLLWELDQVVGEKQLSRLPVARSGRASLLLHEKYPDLAMDIDEERRRRVRDMAFKWMGRDRDDDKKPASSSSPSYKARVGSQDEAMTAARTAEGPAQTSKASYGEEASPALRPRRSQGDMMFAMDEDACGASSTHDAEADAAEGRPGTGRAREAQLAGAWGHEHDKATVEAATAPPSRSMASLSDGQGVGQAGGEAVPRQAQGRPRKASGPWGPAPCLPMSKPDLRDIMSEASSQSVARTGLVAQSTGKTVGKAGGKMSQKERKRQLQMQVEAEAAAKGGSSKQATVGWETVAPAGRPRAWEASVPDEKSTWSRQGASEAKGGQGAAPPVRKKPLVASEAEPHTSRRRASSPDTRFPGQGRTHAWSARPAGPRAGEQERPLMPHSRRYTRPTAAEAAGPPAGASMADIIGQQRREQELAKEAMAKRSLQEIQQEQAFQEWWDQESRRAQDEEEARRRAKGQDRRPAGGSINKRGRKGKGGKFKGGSARSEAAGSSAHHDDGPGASSSAGAGRAKGADRGKGGKA